jgi:hypothetical protein
MSALVGQNMIRFMHALQTIGAYEARRQDWGVQLRDLLYGALASTNNAPLLVPLLERQLEALSFAIKTTVVLYIVALPLFFLVGTCISVFNIGERLGAIVNYEFNEVGVVGSTPTPSADSPDDLSAAGSTPRLPDDSHAAGSTLTSSASNDTYAHVVTYGGDQATFTGNGGGAEFHRSRETIMIVVDDYYKLSTTTLQKGGVSDPPVGSLATKSTILPRSSKYEESEPQLSH